MNTPTKPPEQSNETNNNPMTAPPAGAEPNAVSAYAQKLADAVVPIDKVCHESEDGQFRIRQLVTTARRFPPSQYPCIVMQFLPREHTRIRQIEGGFVEVMLTNLESERFIDAMNSAALATGKGQLYQILQRVPEKTHQHKARWKSFNEKRVATQKKPGKWWLGKKKHSHRSN